MSCRQCGYFYRDQPFPMGNPFLVLFYSGTQTNAGCHDEHGYRGWKQESEDAWLKVQLGSM